MQEEKNAETANFITLTYSTEFVPITENGFLSLNPKHTTLFVKRLRNYYQPRTIRYYLCGEYGAHRYRPHYHMILFNADINHVEKEWTYGDIYNGTVTGASVAYSLKYLMKQGRIPMHPRDDRHPEFQRFSKGLGKNYLTTEIRNYHEADLFNRMYVQDGDLKIAMPRYYKNKIYTGEEIQQIGQYLSTKIVDKELSGKEEIAIFDYYQFKQRASDLKNHKL